MKTLRRIGSGKAKATAKQHLAIAKRHLNKAINTTFAQRKALKITIHEKGNNFFHLMQAGLLVGFACSYSEALKKADYLKAISFNANYAHLFILAKGLRLRGLNNHRRDAK